MVIWLVLMDLQDIYCQFQFDQFMMNSQALQATKEHCKYCFEVLLAKLVNLQAPEFPKSIANVTSPLFVTWSQLKNGQLRGCIGTFESYPLATSLSQFTLTSALKDPRFNPISIDEIEDLTVEVSLLTNFQKNSKLLEWQIGRHGIIIDFMKNNKRYEATFLPEIAAEEGWNQQETIKNLIRKSGYPGSLQAIGELNLTTYQSSKAKLSYEEYRTLIQFE